MSIETTPVEEASALPARLAELVLSVARRLTLLEHQAPGTVPLSQLEAMVMRHVDAEPGTAPSRISATLGLKSSNTSAALRELEAKGFIRRTVDPTDGRGVRVEPTPVARENLALMHDHWVGRLAPHLPDVTALGAAVDLLARLDGALEASSGTASAATGQEG